LDWNLTDQKKENRSYV